MQVKWATLVGQHSFSLNCEQSGLGNLCHFEGRNRVPTAQFMSNKPYDWISPFLLKAPGLIGALLPRLFDEAVSG